LRFADSRIAKPLVIQFFQNRNSTKSTFSNMKLHLLLLIFGLIIGFYPPSVCGQKKMDFNGRWYGISTVDHGFGIRDQYEYELVIQNNKGVISGYSVTVLTQRGKKYTAKAAIEGTAKGTFLKCRETHNIYEDKLPNSNWIPFEKMELIFKFENNQPVLEGLYQMQDNAGGRILLKKKPPQV
jgi:hypothetical protein